MLNFQFIYWYSNFKITVGSTWEFSNHGLDRVTKKQASTKEQAFTVCKIDLWMKFVLVKIDFAYFYRF